MMVVDRVGLERGPGIVYATGRVRARGREPVQLRIGVADADAGALRPTGSPWLAATLLPAMMTGDRLAIDAPVSAKLRAGIDRVQDVLIAWWGERYALHRVSIEAPTEEVMLRGRARAACFSRGVDSYYTVLAGRKPASEPGLTHLLYSGTIDFMDAAERPQRERALAATARAAEDVGVPLLVVYTNLRGFHEGYAGWIHGYAQALAAVGHALSGLLGELRISTAYHRSQGLPWASHPSLAGPLSSESMTVRHVGSDVRRIDKVRAIGTDGSALRHLRVCIVPESERNCGRCEKCLRTMLELHAAGALERCPTFAGSLSPDALSRLRLSRAQAVWYGEVLEALGDAPDDRAYARAIREALARSPV
jgi:hypothetical protein